MSIVEISAPFYNPRNPKCRNCCYYITKDDTWSSGECEKKKIHRVHNDRACRPYFRRIRPKNE